MTIDPVAVQVLRATLPPVADHSASRARTQREFVREGYAYYRGERTTLASPDLVRALVVEIERLKAGRASS